MKTQRKNQKQVQPTSKKTEESLSYTLEVRDKEGRVIERISAPSRSYVEQWNQLVNIQAQAGLGKLVRATDGLEWSGNRSTWALSARGAVADVALGTRVGKGTTAVAIDDYAIETPLGEGVGLDEFNHQAVTFTVPAVVGPTCSYTIKRILINNSGATISGIREIGVYTDRGSARSYLLFRDVLPSAVYVPHGGSITVTYTVAVTV